MIDYFKKSILMIDYVINDSAINKNSILNTILKISCLGAIGSHIVLDKLFCPLNIIQKCIFIDITTSKYWLFLLLRISIFFFMVAILTNNMAFTDKEYSPFYIYIFSVMAEDIPSIISVSCTVTFFL